MSQLISDLRLLLLIIPSLTEQRERERVSFDKGKEGKEGKKKEGKKRESLFSLKLKLKQEELET